MTEPECGVAGLTEWQDGPMPTDIRLVPPTTAGHGAFIECLADFADAGEAYLAGSSIAEGEDAPVGEAAFLDYVSERLAEEDPDTDLEDGWVHCSSRWIVAGGAASVGEEYEPGGGELRDGDQILGFLAIRHALTPYLHDRGGHIGYSVRPSVRGCGIATIALQYALVEAGELGISQILVTCDDTNSSSRRVVEKAGGQLEDVREGKCRYWFGEQPWPQRATA